MSKRENTKKKRREGHGQERVDWKLVKEKLV